MPVDHQTLPGTVPRFGDSAPPVAWGGHTLRPGSYRLEATPRNTAGAGLVRKSFTVK
jgi:hypothetical protein